MLILFVYKITFFFLLFLFENRNRFSLSFSAEQIMSENEQQTLVYNHRIQVSNS